MSPAEGWAPMFGNQRTFHYFRNNLPLCRHWSLHESLRHELDPGDRGSRRKGEDDCTACYRRSRIVVADKPRG